ncbi:MAG: C40 family peptidase [Planctomycetes bacterium]|nr:C40 family peptidase [Planctomycetota bacterium]
MTSAHDFAAAALQLVGTPWHHQGRLPGVGLDCVGVVVAAAKTCGVEVEDRRDYTLPADPNLFLLLLAENCERDAAPTLEVGRLVVFRIGPHPQHIAIVVEGDRIVHSVDRKRRGVAVESLTESWRYRVHSTWALRGLSWQP